jgi:uncharacterized protein
LLDKKDGRNIQFVMLWGITMRVDVKSLLERVGRVLEVQGEIELEPVAQNGESVEFVGPAEVTARLESTGGSILASGRAKAVVALQCARCLEPYRLPLEVDFQAEFRATDGGPVPPGEDGDETEVVPFSGDELELDATVRESLLLALPMKPLCREDCPGLCPQCGQNLRSGTCRCSLPADDERLAVLSELLGERGRRK